MTPSEIQKRLKDAKTTQRALAQKLSVSEVTIPDIVSKRRVSHRVMTAIAEVLGEDVRLIFPEYYLQPPKRKTSHSKPV